MTKLQQGVIKNPPPHITIEVTIPGTIDTKQQLADYLKSEYSIDINLVEDSLHYENLYYNSDVRSVMGFLKELGGDTATLFLRPMYFIEGWEENWAKLIANSEISWD